MEEKKKKVERECLPFHFKELRKFGGADGYLGGYLEEAGGLLR